MTRKVTQRLPKVYLFDIPNTVIIGVVYHRNTEGLDDVHAHRARSRQPCSIGSADPQLALVQNI